MRCKVLLGSFSECDPFGGQAGGDGLQRTGVSIESAENNHSKKVKSQSASKGFALRLTLDRKFRYGKTHSH